MIDKILNIFWIGIVGLFAGLIITGILYMGVLYPIIESYRSKKAKHLYPEFYTLIDKRNKIHKQWNELDNKKEYIENKINNINKEIQYTPLENISSKQIKIEYLKKERIKIKEKLTILRAEINKLNNQIEEILNSSKLLQKVHM